MTLHEGPIHFLTEGDRDSLAALPGLRDLSGVLGCRLSIVHVLDGAGDSRLAAALAALPGDAPGVLAVPVAELDAALALLTGILALRPTRHGPIMRLLAGTQHERLLHHGRLPLLALPGGQLPPLRRVLFPADLAPRSEAPFDQVVALCRTLNAELHLLHVYGDDRLLPSEQDLARRAAAKSPRELMAIDQQRLQSLAERAKAQGLSPIVKTAEGRAHTQILAYAAANAIGLIAMASHGPRSIEDILLGSTTARVIQRSPATVLAIRA